LSDFVKSFSVLMFGLSVIRHHAGATRAHMVGTAVAAVTLCLSIASMQAKRTAEEGRASRREEQMRKLELSPHSRIA
jgi:hypothetical protein